MADNLKASEEIKSTVEWLSLHKFLQGHNDLEATQDKFCEPVEDDYMSKQNADDVEALLWTAWKAITGTAVHTPFESDRRQRLADFVLSLKTRPDLVKGDAVCKVWDATVWKDLPVFGAQLRDVWNYGKITAPSLIKLTKTAPTNDDSHVAKEWLDLNAFVATITNKTPDYALFGIWTIRSGLEQQDASDIAIEAAAVWLLYAGQAIFELSKSNKSFDGKLAQPGPRFSDKSWTGFSKERWRAWADRLSEVQAKGQRGEQLITRARKAMGDILEQ